jgi:hypothetical protein
LVTPTTVHGDFNIFRNFEECVVASAATRKRYRVHRTTCGRGGGSIILMRESFHAANQPRDGLWWRQAHHREHTETLVRFLQAQLERG